MELRVRVPHRPDGGPGTDALHVRAVRDGEPDVTAAELTGVDDAGSDWRVRLVAHNPVTSYRFLLSGPRGAYRWLNGTGVHARDVTDTADFRLVTHPPPPAWVADAVVYQVFPDRFARSGSAPAAPPWADAAAWDDAVLPRGEGVERQWFGGDLDGVVEHLDHVRDLGATTLYLTPFFESRSNHRYDAVSFERVDPALGGDAALARLLAAAHRAGLRVLGDLTANHTGVHHEWFRRAQADPGSEESGYYRFREHPHDYESWLGVPTLPSLDHASPALRRRLYGGDGSVVARWLRAGLDGWRMDVANMTGRSGASDLTHDVARAVRAAVVAQRPDAWLLAEHAHDASADLAGDGWHGAMDYAGFTRPVWAWLDGAGPGGGGEPHGLEFLGLPVTVPALPGEAVAATMREVHAAMSWRAWQASTSHLDTHDTPRFRSVAGGGTSGGVDSAGRGRDRHLVGLALQMTLPGVPCVFMGDELGLTAEVGEHARTPMPWARPGAWDVPTLAAYRTWVRLRRQHTALRRGGLRWVDVRADSLTFLREHPEGTVLVHATRRAGDPVGLPLAALGLRDASQLVALTAAGPLAASGGVVTLPAHGPGASAWRLDP